MVVLCSALICIAAEAQKQRDIGLSSLNLSATFEAAQKDQAAGNLAQATLEYKRFVSEALRRLAAGRAASGDLGKSVALLEEAIELTPDDTSLRLDFAGACRASGDLPKAKAAVETVPKLQPENPKAHLELGRVLSQANDDGAAMQQLEMAVAIEPNFENGYALAKQDLKLKKLEQAAKIFAEMKTGLGESGELHLEFGKAYAEAGYPERAIPQFERALALNPRIRGGHYSLGAAYLLGLGNVMQDKAETEFRRELSNHPDDSLSLYQLGSIKFNRHQLEASEHDLERARELDSRNPDTHLLLGQIYNETGRVTEAEAALRQSIALTGDVSHNNYQVQRAHYLLARLLIHNGRPDEAKVEMATANELQKQTVAATQNPEAGRNSAPAPGIGKHQTLLDPDKTREADAFEQKIKDAVGDSYNNVGAMDASLGSLSSALHAFREAAKWDPALEGLDYNWGRAAFFARDYEQAIGPLSRYLAGHQDDIWVRAALGSSCFSLQRYQQAKETLRSMDRQLNDRPQLNYIYAVSELKSGDFDAGVARLQDLEKANPDIALIPQALAEAFASIGENDQAAHETELAREIQSRRNRAAAPPKPN